MIVALGGFSAHAVAATARDFDLCTTASAVAQRKAGTPPLLLHAIGLVETGRYDAIRHAFTPWPWSVDADGIGHFYASKQEAVAAVLQFQAAGAVSIDVGCMQVNLRYHPAAFASLDEAFTPAANTAYAARYLRALYRQTGDWSQAAGFYHSQTPELGAAYRARVLAIWPHGPEYAESGREILPDAALRVPPDPHHVLTAQYRARLAEDARFRRARDARMHIADAGQSMEHADTAQLENMAHSPAP